MQSSRDCEILATVCYNMKQSVMDSVSQWNRPLQML